MNKSVNGQMIALAREARGLTQRALADHLCVTQATISRYESGWVEVPDEHLAAMAEFLGRPISFFFWSEQIRCASCLYHRKRARIPVRELRQIHAHVNILRIQATRLLKHTRVKSSYSFHRMDMNSLGGAEEAARRLRQLWQLPSGPVRNVVDSIESAGGIVFRCPFGTTRVDGISQWPLDTPDLPPVFFVSDGAPGDRGRWTLAHEIGHVIMHHLPTNDPEPEANRFAAEFLMPAHEIEDDLRNLTLPKAAALKGYWKVSMQAIIKWARALQKITENQCEYLFKQMAHQGYRLCEPVPIVPEEPQLISEMLNVHRLDSGKSLDSLCEYLGESPEGFHEKYLRNFAGLRLVG